MRPARAERQKEVKQLHLNFEFGLLIPFFAPISVRLDAYSII